ncbi:MAG: hypothetical protein AB8B65_11515 [Kordia sp.]|uniref:hypothetical protein n=1 Tax=Kordia sp. TaxID=1965332 RepID=UPI003858B4D8
MFLTEKMSKIKETLELIEDLKSFSTLVIPMAFWYISLYLFHQSFFYSSDLLLRVIFCAFFAIIVFPFTSKISKKISNHNNEFSKKTYLKVALGAIIQTAILAILIFIFYTLQFWKGIKIHFYYFLLIYFSVLAILALFLPTFKAEQVEETN